MRSPLKICKEIEFFFFYSLNFSSRCRYRESQAWSFCRSLPSDFRCAWQTLTFSSFLVSPSRWADVAHVCVVFFYKSTILSTDDSNFAFLFTFFSYSRFLPVTRLILFFFRSVWAQLSLFLVATQHFTLSFMCDQLTLREVGCEFAYNSSHTFDFSCSCST